MHYLRNDVGWDWQNHQLEIQVKYFSLGLEMICIKGLWNFSCRYSLWNETFSALCSTSCCLLLSFSVMSDCLQPLRLQHARLPCPSLSPRVCSNNYPLSPWCHLIIFCWPLFLLPSIIPIIRVFSNESVLHIRWPKYYGFNFSIGPSSEYSGLIFFGIDKFDFLAVQGILKSLIWHHNSKTLSLWCSAFFMSNSHICIWLLERS